MVRVTDTYCINHGNAKDPHDNSSGPCSWVLPTEDVLRVTRWGHVEIGNTVWFESGFWEITEITRTSRLSYLRFGMENADGLAAVRVLKREETVPVIWDPKEKRILPDQMPLTVRSLITELLDLDTGLDAAVYIGKGCGPLNTLTETVSDSPHLVLSSSVLPDD
jgi:hypothetical protein